MLITLFGRFVPKGVKELVTDESGLFVRLTMNSRHSLALAAFALIGSASGLHATNTYNVVWDGTTAVNWTAEDGEYESEVFLADYSQQNGVTGMLLPRLTVDFVTSKEFTVNLSAPVGYAIRFTPPPIPGSADGDPNTEFRIYVSSLDAMWGPNLENEIVGINFVGLQGAIPTPNLFSSTLTYGTNGGGFGTPEFSAEARFDLNGSFSFTSLTLSFTAPEGTDIVRTDILPQASLVALWRGDYDGADPSNPGAWVDLVAVPEPSTYGLMLGGLALVGAAVVRRRKASK